MLDSVRSLLEQSPLLALFAAIGIGYAIGRISIAGFSLDIGAVLFAGLALGAIAPKAAPPALVSSIGLVMFLYGIGIQYGRQFFAGLGGAGLMWNALGVAGVLCALAVALAAGAAFGVVARAHAGALRRLADEHAGAAGRHRRRRRPRARDWILGGLSDRHHRADPVHLRFLAARESQTGAGAGAARQPSRSCSPTTGRARRSPR